MTIDHSQTDDSREYVTEHAFRVAPELLGHPLSGPWRRGIALTLDGLAVLLLANSPSLIFGFAAAFVLLRASVKPPQGGLVRRWVRFGTRAATAMIVFAVAVSSWETVANLRNDDDGEEVPLVTMGFGGTELSGVGGLIAGARIVAVVTSENEEEAREALDSLLEEMEEIGVTNAELIAMLAEVETSGGERPWVQAAVDSALVELTAAAAAEAQQDSIRALDGDEALSAYVGAILAGDTAAAADLRGELPNLLAAERLNALETEIDLGEERVAALETALAEADEGQGIIATFRTLANDLGLGFGWGSLYFTAFTVLWRGRTPGKRLMGIRVVQLDGRPIGWWSAFGRFAGYAAGLATGLLGFLQIFWDRNRQGIQDQIAKTVVVRDRR